MCRTTRHYGQFTVVQLRTSALRAVLDDLARVELLPQVDIKHTQRDLVANR
jgi:hypothetical protein